MNRASLITTIVVVWLTGLFLIACGNTPTERPTEMPPEPAPTAQEGGLTLTDALGRTVEFSEPPQRIVVAGKSTLTVINAMYMFPEAQERVIALTSGNQKPGDFLSLVDPTFDQKALLEKEAGPEQIAPLKPDAVVLRSFMADKLGRPLEELSIPVVYVDLETPEQYVRDVAILGQLFANGARAWEIQSFYRSKLEATAQAVEGLSEDQMPRILIVQHNNQGGQVALNVPPAPWIQTTEAELAGSVPVWKEAAQGGWTVVNFEQIAAWDPDQIFVISYQADSSAVVEQLKADPQWQALRATQAGQVYGFAADIFSWDQPDPRWILGATWLAAKVHPDLFPDLDMVQQISQFFEQLYGMDQAAIQEQILPNLKGDIE